MKFYEPAPDEVSPAQFEERLSVCEGCEHRTGKLCRLSGRHVPLLARFPTWLCPLTVESTPIVEEVEIATMAIVTCYFNPVGYRNIRRNYDRFAAAIAGTGLPLYTLELAFDDDPFQLSGPRVRQIRGDRRHHLLWQKERLLNLLVSDLEGYDAIAWIDADVLFGNENWAEETRQVLRTHAVCQPFQEAYWLGKDGQVVYANVSAAFNYCEDREKSTNFSLSHPGFAWAARTDWLRSVGLYEYHIVGGGDGLMIAGLLGLPLMMERSLNRAWRETLQEWSLCAFRAVRGACGYAPGPISHLYHGSRENRNYVDRYKRLVERDFDPRLDLRVDNNGLLAWTETALRDKPEMIRHMASWTSCSVGR